MATFGEKLKNARLKKGMKQAEVAEILNCAPTSLTNWENDKVQPSLDVLSRLCEAYEIAPLSLLDKAYSYNDVVRISKKSYSERTYEEHIALNFSVSILEKTSDKEVARLEKLRENEEYICQVTGLTPDALEALKFDWLFDDESTGKISPAGLEALNKLLTCQDGLRALENIAIFLRGGEFRFADGSKAVSVKVGEFTAPGRSVTKSFSFTPDMVRSIAQMEFLKALDNMKTHIPQEEIDAGIEQVKRERTQKNK